MTRCFAAGLSLMMLAVMERPAEAHFLWLRVHPADGGLQANAYFSEEPVPSNPALIDKIAKAQVKMIKGSSDAQALTMKELATVAGQKTGTSLGAEIQSQDPCRVETQFDYGVYRLDSGATLLKYYAKSIHASQAAELRGLARCQAQMLDVVPDIDHGRLVVTVLWNNKPLSGAEVLVLGPNDKTTELTTDANGRVAIDTLDGLRGIRASYIEANREGEHAGKKYTQIGHFATLTLDVPLKAVASATPAGNAESDQKPATTVAANKKPAAQEAPIKESLEARKLLAHARESRAVWVDFPGFTADVALCSDGEQVKGTLHIDGDGRVTLKVDKLGDIEWFRRQFNSLVQHRMPDGSLGDGAGFVDGETNHPLGRRIRLTEASMGSDYRIRQDVVAQVNRTMGAKLSFTISVLDVARNAEGKYLPTVFTISTWDKNAGGLLATETVMHAWNRFGKFDLPTKVKDVECGPGIYHAREVVLTHHRLGNRSTAAAK